MKSKFLLVIVIPFLTIPCFSQTIDTNSQEFHLKQKRTNITAGWILVGVGSAAIVGGIALDVDKNLKIFETEESSYDSTGIIIACIGGGMVLSSIPCFISAGKHRKLAKTSVTFKNARFPDGNLSYNVQPVVSVSIKF